MLRKEFNSLIILEVNEESRIQYDDLDGEDLEDGFYLMACNDSAIDDIEGSNGTVKEGKHFLQPIIGPIESKEEAKQVGAEIADVLQNNPSLNLEGAILLWDSMYNLSPLEDANDKANLN